MEHQSPSPATVARRVRERLTAIKLHAASLRRKVRCGEPLDPSAVEHRLALIEQEVDAAAVAVDELPESDARA